jgi:predicted metal-dependent HD superfamily phosphohydrolase
VTADDLPARPDAGLERALVARWTEIVGDAAPARRAGAALVHRWSEPERCYHDLVHLAAVLDHVDELVRAEPGTASDADAVVLAAYFHDAVYDPTTPDNEARSAALAGNGLEELGLPPLRVREVVRLVLLTATHAPDPDDGNGAVLCDADLAVLAAEPAAYAAYAAAVRAEHAHVPEPQFRAGRARVLTELLAHEVLYRTRTGRTWWEAAARRNVGAELLLLNASTADRAGVASADPPPGAG